MDRYLKELKMFFSFSNSFFIQLSGFLIIQFCYLLFVLIYQVFATFYAWFHWLLILL